MNMDESGTQLVAASETSCCYLSNAPLPESQYKASELSLKTSPVAVLDTTWQPPPVEEERPADVTQDLSPPPLQPLLCTFLI